MFVVVVAMITCCKAGSRISSSGDGILVDGILALLVLLLVFVFVLVCFCC